MAFIADLVPGVTLLEVLGQGGMGVVYKGRQHLLNRLVAVKVLPATTADGSSIVSRFKREARVLARLNHPRVVAIYDYGSAKEFSYFTMDYVEGCNLRQMLKNGPLEPEIAVGLFCQMADGLQHAHDRGVVHRDIKPENLLVDKKGRLKIADFGIATLAWDDHGAGRLTQEGQRIGTPYYVAPEQAQRTGSVDHRADVYAAGTVLYEMLTGVLPLGRFAPPSQKAQVSSAMDKAVLGALEPEASARYQSIEKFKRAVQSAWGCLDTDGEPQNPAAPADLAQAAKKLELECEAKSNLALSLFPIPSSPSSHLENTLERLEASVLMEHRMEMEAKFNLASTLERLKEIYTQLDREVDIIRTSLNLGRAYFHEGCLAAAIIEYQNLLLRPLPEMLAKEIRHDATNWNSVLIAQEGILDRKPEMYRLAEMLKHAYSRLDIGDKVDSSSRKLARAYVLKKKWPQAQEEYRELLQRNPDDGDIRQALVEVEAMIAKESSTPPIPH